MTHPDLHGRIMPTKDGRTTGPLHWVPERHTWTDPQMSDEWRPDGTGHRQGGGPFVMPTFRIHVQGMPALEIVAETAAEARKIAEGKNLGRVMKIKLVRDAS